ncbi:MAG: ExbD/TolR family protein [Bacteroidales bacterium]
MADIQQDHGDEGKKGKPKKQSTHIDFTPMVDLGFLLITFFMLATTLVKPQTMEIVLPPSKDKIKTEDQPPIKESRAVTILLGKNNKLFYYEGGAAGGKDPKIVESNYSPTGLRKYLIGRNINVITKIRELKAKSEGKKINPEDFENKRIEILKADRVSPIVIIKATDGANYKNLVDILDEMAICSIGSYSIVDVTPYDLGLIKNLNN